MSTSAASTSVDLSRLPPPVLVEQLTFDAIVADMVVALKRYWPAFDATIDDEPLMLLLQALAYRELLKRAEYNDRARQQLVAFATGGNLDHLGALVGVARLQLSADPLVMESDDALRQRIVLAPEGFSVAGPELAYVAHAKSADADVLDASASSPAPGEVLVTVLARSGNGTASAELLAKVKARVAARDVRPMGDLVTVASATIRPFAVDATLYTFAGPDRELLLKTARTDLDTYLADCRRLGRDVTLSGLYAALTVPGIQRVELASPTATIVCDATQTAHCTAVTIAHGGYDD
ncbi:baseplate J/gp47 family protein [uncultured Sphingomonas sp.]|uniref:baseplate assembly protein n=1 Tax=uncultured Sphingomonas sp. TaxID=158754 RepID=UPI0025FC9999|nr:baseplate J/gp47 family protein [uncultured Sphingomonas sp.]